VPAKKRTSVKNLNMFMWEAMLLLIMGGSKGGSGKKAGVLIHSVRRTLPEIAGMRKGVKNENPAKIIEKRQKKGCPKAPLV
jgi:hypothetical protein